MFCYTSVKCQLGSVVGSLEQVNYAQYNQGMRPNQNFYKTLQIPFGQQTTPPDYANNQRVPQKSNLELLLENFLIGLSKQNQELINQTGFLKDSLAKLSSKVDSICTHQKMLETQISQVAQQVASSSQTSRIIPGQPEANPKGQMIDITLRKGRQLEDPIVKTKTIEVEVESEKPQSKKVVVESEKPNAPPPYKPKLCFPQGFDKSKLDEQFRKFIEIIRDKLQPKLKDPWSFSIPCVTGFKAIEKTMCDLGESVSLMSLSLIERMSIG